MTKKELMKIIESDEILYLINKSKEINGNINAHCFTEEEGQIKKKELNSILKEIKELIE